MYIKRIENVINSTHFVLTPLIGKTEYVVVDCGGGTVDLTVHQLDTYTGGLAELHKATGGACGATGVDLEFEKLLKKIFGKDFIDQFKLKRSAGWVDLMIAFEARKRTAAPNKTNPLNISLPFAFIDYYKKHRGSSIESAVRKYGDPNVKWSNQGMLRISPELMKELFQPVLSKIIEHVSTLINKPTVQGVQFLFLVGGFAESPLLQAAVRDAFSSKLKVIIPQDVGLTILKGAVLFGIDPTIIRIRRAAVTYGVGVLNRFIPGKHPREKYVRKSSIEWCTDIFDKFVTVDQSVSLGEKVTRSYAPAKNGQKSIVINIFSTENADVKYVTDPGVTKCGFLRIDLPEVVDSDPRKPRELQACMTFAETEIKVSAMDVVSGNEVKASIEFLKD